MSALCPWLPVKRRLLSSAITNCIRIPMKNVFMSDVVLLWSVAVIVMSGVMVLIGMVIMFMLDVDGSIGHAYAVEQSCDADFGGCCVAEGDNIADGSGGDAGVSGVMLVAMVVIRMSMG
ncbi:hypothetical protein DPMN_174910 [Dreissena polymorpha]|uniref:Transmembrane protein n=1 Tax=Dreissena polymorpha TaxID=45954 RepID=A0A9D4E691_DREPO|nr:hypothetical protein DPMN_174910 [Dreissena polymorpha]